MSLLFRHVFANELPKFFLKCKLRVCLAKCV